MKVHSWKIFMLFHFQFIFRQVWWFLLWPSVIIFFDKVNALSTRWTREQLFLRSQVVSNRIMKIDLIFFCFFGYRTKIAISPFIFLTRMHSSRMRTARSSSRLLGEGVSASVHAGIHIPSPPPPGPGHSLPPGVGLETPQCGPRDPSVGLETPPGVGLETPQVWAWRPPQPDPSTSPLGLETSTSPLWTEWLTDRCKNITFSNFVCEL